ncbi:DinB family protein [uncultured Ramlibacter sp.]|uniref:DinB family protein n=1 Tax=uncultured Ramlibacter sp. TaxID=260755 RepID=UPI002604FC61|nr:DinB family protein [uncultured Ramlibacter sp.]
MDEALRDNYRFLARYNRWFNQRLYDACEQLNDAERKRDRGAFFGSLHQTLTHLVLADKMWLERFTRQGVVFAALPAQLVALPPGSDYTSDLHPDWADLRRTRAALDEAIEAWTQEMAADFPVSTMRYANTKGVQREHAAWKALTHFFNHQAHHRGQVTTLLMQAGIDPGVTDLVALL